MIATISCGHDSKRLIGVFQVLNKEKTAPNHDYGYVTLVSFQADTIKVLISLEETYLNIKKGDFYLVGENRYGGLFLNIENKRGVVGYQKIIEKTADGKFLKCKVATRGDDTISVMIPRVIYYTVSPGDSVLVKKNRDIKEFRYYVE
jgi:hypothetical protein